MSCAKLIFVTTGRLLAAHQTPTGSFALCESEASETKRPVGTEINPTL
ncbi:MULTISPECIES: hypothetical protein [unclassified Lysinibacillus]|nr:MULTISPECIES: hypothetical protein [unclassified Lysinibacillus]MDM5250006.1 hypothetical protein [Lysinibacillus sp. G4S2]